jgi:hypothetical protein
MLFKIFNLRFRLSHPPAACPYCNGPIGYGAGRWWGLSCDHEGSY